MIIDKVEPFYTAEELRQLELTQNEISWLINRANEQLLGNEDGAEVDRQLNESWAALADTRAAISARVEQRYIDSLKGDKNRILDEIKDVMDAAEKKDYQTYQRSLTRRYKEHLSMWTRTAEVHESMDAIRRLMTTGYINCRDYLLWHVHIQLEALEQAGLDKGLGIELVEDRTGEFYKRPKGADKIKTRLAIDTRAFIPMLNGPGTNRLQLAAAKGVLTVHEGSERVIQDGDYQVISLTTQVKEYLQAKDYKIFSEGLDKLTGGLRPSTQLLLDFFTVELTRQNGYKRAEESVNRELVLSFDNYLEARGVPSTKTSKDKARTEVIEDLKILRRLAIEWTENKKGKPFSYGGINIATFTLYQNEQLYFSFSPELASYLTKAYVMQYPRALFRVDNRNPNAYAVGRKLALHHSIDHNHKAGTADLISVKSLLECYPKIPTYEAVKKAGQNFTQRIIEPFEKALNKNDFIKWEYANAKGEPLTDEQLENFTYQDFIKLYIKFTLEGAPDPSERIARRAKERAEAIKKANKKKSSSMP